jgi:DNA modification methylase
MTTASLVLVDVPIDELRPDPANPRRISDAQLEALTRSLKEYGFIQPVLARREDKTVIGGHQRLIAARRLGYKTVPTVFLDLSVEQARVLNVALNQISGDWDRELLARLLADLKPVEDIDLTLTGFAEDELAKLLKSLDARDKKERVEDFDLDAALEAAQSAPRAQPGEIWALGDHRLMCGDSTNPSDVERLMAGEKASLLATDPPYLVDYQADNHPASKANKGRKNKDKHWDDYHDPETSVEFFKSFLRAAFPHLRPNTAFYQWHADKRRMLVEQAWRESGLFLHQAIVWVKARAVLTHSHFLWQSEPCLYGWLEGQQPKRKPPANASNVWQLDQRGESMGIHPTQKPVEVFLRPIEWHTEIGDVCYEPFSGSGTQIIAAEKLSRRCFAMEQEPRYVDVAVLRWEAFSGEKARRLD